MTEKEREPEGGSPGPANDDENKAQGSSNARARHGAPDSLGRGGAGGEGPARAPRPPSLDACEFIRRVAQEAEDLSPADREHLVHALGRAAEHFLTLDPATFREAASQVLEQLGRASAPPGTALQLFNTLVLGTSARARTLARARRRSA